MTEDGPAAGERAGGAGGAPPALVRLSPLLVNLFPGAAALLTIEGVGTVADLVAALDARHPGMAARICDESPAIRRHMNVFVDGARASLATPIRPGADIFILTAISGG
ncbi:MoaD/ThiS family protein [Prosthecodimorpha staleyi]|uniref:MoaD/ThiS family protein n=1 Tax=Prosthecodimorpha staleyi TaxID=2840188 RepID=A0A947D8C8_9HYPH|nr:MoaD/ThiS family protein [Prosthecodimorpha staleyi]MBT9292861.1 MoaD/ThiS family protein [Prosthecodimorpha staleyi]